MAHRSQSSSVGMGDNPLSPNYLAPHYREEYRLAIDALVEHDLQGYYEFLQSSDMVEFLSRPEIDHIKATLTAPASQQQSGPAGVPELTYPHHHHHHQEGVPDGDGSSDTYWPMHSDIAAPGLDLGWPLQQHSFIGPTEVTTLVNPSDPDMPSIKMQARRLIKDAQHVIAVVMDMFTDVDIFSDLLDAAARHVPVYILLDEQNAHHFVAMATNCRVNLDLVHMMRVRTVAGITYFCRTGKSFKGQVKDRFLLTDCRAVLSGNYSFMWSYEKIHRCIAHLFLGELVATFDEEFRILFAQSEPLSVDQSLVVAVAGSESSSTSSYLSQGPGFGLKRTQSLRNPRGLGLTYGGVGGVGDLDRNPSSALPGFRRCRENDLFRHSSLDLGVGGINAPGNPGGITIGKYSQQQFRLQQSFLEQGRSIVSRQMEIQQQSASAFKRHSYAEGTQENYSSSRHFMKSRVLNNLEETTTDYHREQSQSSYFYQEGAGGPGSGHGHYDRLRGRVAPLPIDQYSNSSFPSEPDAAQPGGGTYGGRGDYFSSDDLRGGGGGDAPPAAGRYDAHSSHRRPTVGQAYACQSSPTQPHPPEKQTFLNEPSATERDPDPSLRQGLRSWRINSYLSAYEDGGEEGLVQPMGPDAFFDEPQPPQQQQQQPMGPDASAPRFGTREQQQDSKPLPAILRPRYGKPVLPEKDSTTTRTTTKWDGTPSGADFKSSILEKERQEREKEWDRGGGREMAVDVDFNREAPEQQGGLSKHESFRTRVNPLLQRSSRLRSSLIFSSSKTETHSGGLGLKTATEEEEELDPMRTSSIVQQILEKRRFMNREPFEWKKKAEEMDKTREKEKEMETERDNERRASLREESEPKEEAPKPPSRQVWSPPESGTSASAASTEQQSSSLNMNDPASRLQYFKELAAKRKASKMGTETSLRAAEPAEKKPDISDKPPPLVMKAPAPTKIPHVSVNPPSPELPEPKKLDAAASSKPASELTRRPSLSASKPPAVFAKPALVQLKPAEASKKEESAAPEAPKKESGFKSLKPLPSPKIFKRDPLKLKGLVGARRSCGEEMLTTVDATTATDSEKSEAKKGRSHSSSSMTRTEAKEGGLHKNMGSNTSINTLGEGKADGKPLDFLKKQTQRLKGFLGPKDKKPASSGDDKAMITVREISEDSGRTGKVAPPPTATATSTAHDQSSASNHKTAALAIPGTSRYQTNSGSVLFSSNLRDDTKVILGQISANSQKHRLEREEAGGERGDPRGDLDSDGEKGGVERQNSLKKNRFLRPQANPQEREGLLKRIESMRKEKKVYSRFEMGNSLG